MQVAQAVPHTLVVRGGRMIVSTFRVGNTTVHIANDHMVTGLELDRVHDELSEANYAIWDSLSKEEQLEVIGEFA